MSSISKLFFRESFFTKVHDNNNNGNNSSQELQEFELKKSRDNKSNSSGGSNLLISDDNNFNGNFEIELFVAKVETITPIDEKLNNKAIYNIKIKSSVHLNDSWIKSYTLDELIRFRDYLLKYTYSIINLPFPTKSWMRFLPYIGKKYDEHNWDILLENKFLLDDFFSTICKDKEIYKLSGFIEFFSKPTRNVSKFFQYY